MGESKSGGYKKLPTLTPEQQTLLSQIISQATGQFGPQGLFNQSSDVLSSFLTGEGFEPIKKAAYQQFEQETIPSILNAFGSGAKSSSALNQALAAGASNLNTNLAAQLAQMQLGAAGQAAQQSLAPTQIGLGAQPFAYMQKQKPFWQDLLLSGIGAAGQAAGSAARGGV